MKPTYLNDHVKEWTNFQTNLDPDRRQLFNELIQDLQKHHDMTKTLDSETILLSLVIELKRELEDVRNQLELAQTHIAEEQVDLPQPVQP